MSEKKASLRKVFRDRRAALGPEARAAASRRITERLLALPAVAAAAGLAAFWSLEEEVDLKPFIAAALAGGQRVFLPRVDRSGLQLDFCPFNGQEDTLAPGPMNLLEPRTEAAALAAIDLVVVPALAFDLNRHRLGYGAGHYDRFLKIVDATTIGVAFDVQTIDILPIAEHDVAVDAVVTESRVF